MSKSCVTNNVSTQAQEITAVIANHQPVNQQFKKIITARYATYFQRLRPELYTRLARG